MLIEFVKMFSYDFRNLHLQKENKTIYTVYSCSKILARLAKL
jgi:hypothetical protein